MAHTPDILRVGIIGCGEIVQVSHIPTLGFLAHKFRITYLCDVSQQALEFCRSRVPIGAHNDGHVQITTDAEELCASSEVDVVLVASANAYHVPHGKLALKHNKHCLIEKPVALNYGHLDDLRTAEEASEGKVFVGTMRRYATAFLDAVEEVGGMEKIQYARVRDIIGKNETFVGQSGTFSRRFSDVPDEEKANLKQLDEEIYEQTLAKDFGVPNNAQNQGMLRMLGGLGSHDLSAMRELLGMPMTAAGAVLTLPGIFSVLFHYRDSGREFPVTYESGSHDVPQFDAHIEVYGPTKIVRVEWDSPYVKGLPVTMTVKEKVGEGGLQERKVRMTYEDPYTLEFLEWWDVVVKGKEIKTNLVDARKDLDLYRMILAAGEGTNKP
ncbi:oxidoreductase family, NAD-binding rossmann fold domain-containing protein [Sarocladium implicatum]|nr:oxidoreductase family, NAD-binding rossmann fold domain-containing protein [Sarocladium implicatum]